jgi:hypothetical protein
MLYAMLSEATKKKASRPVFKLKRKGDNLPPQVQQ